MIGEVQVRQEVLLGMLDHFKRNMVQKLFDLPIVIGAVQGRIIQGTVVFEKVFEVPPKVDPDTQSVLHLVDEDYLGHKLELEKQVNSDIDLVGFYLCGPELFSQITNNPGSPLFTHSYLAKAFEAFKKRSELLFGTVFDTTKQVSMVTGLPLLVAEAIHTDASNQSANKDQKDSDHHFRHITHTIAADPSEIVCINDLLREASGSSSTQSGYAKGMRSWQQSFDNYIERLRKLEAKLAGDASMSAEELRLAKEVVINFPKHYGRENHQTLQEKFITVDTVNLLATALKQSNVQEELQTLLTDTMRNIQRVSQAKR
jgi:JAB1/Mov34/MPN/PAD-1 ubiquitin protease